MSAEKKTIKKIAKKTVKKEPKTKKEQIKEEPKEKQKFVFKPKIEKITVNIGVGEAGERLGKAETVLKNITNHKPVKTISRTTNKDWSIREGMPLGCKVTLRGEEARNFLINALKTRGNKMSDYSFDGEGNLSFGVPDHTLFKDQKYDPSIGIFGMDICITIEKAGYRIKRRRIDRRKIPHKHRVKKEETMKYFAEAFNVEVV